MIDSIGSFVFILDYDLISVFETGEPVHQRRLHNLAGYQVVVLRIRIQFRVVLLHFRLTRALALSHHLDLDLSNVSLHLLHHLEHCPELATPTSTMLLLLLLRLHPLYAKIILLLFLLFLLNLLSVLLADLVKQIEKLVCGRELGVIQHDHLVDRLDKTLFRREQLPLKWSVDVFLVISHVFCCMQTIVTGRDLVLHYINLGLRDGLLKLGIDQSLIEKVCAREAQHF